MEMRAPAKLAAFAAILALVFAGAYAVGVVVGYTLVPATTTLTPARPEEFTFRVTGPDGAAITAFEVEHDKRMHLIVVRRDTSGFQHLHPRMDPNGTWRVPLLVAAGRFDPVDHRPSRSARVDGYQVDLAGDLAYLHVHPEGTPGDGRTPAGPEIVFTTQVPSAGTYRLFLDFRHRGGVHTAAFTVATRDRP
jgi:hypothetical protein